ncbi:MAG: MBL fold metallo-hydrolase [Rhodobacteraceae bacterium]|nr:MBL fold metallo-hydrolase [Paracoccaceae bacterium]
MATEGDFVALLGTKGGPAIRTGSPMPTSSLLSMGGQRIVVDAGLGVTRGLCDQGMALKDIATIFITHLHSDHYLELGPLLHTAWTAGLKTPVRIWGPSGLATYFHGFFLSMKEDIDTRIEDEGRPDLRDLITCHVIRAGDAITLGAINVTAMSSIHPPLTESWSLSFKSTERHVVFSGDTAHNPALAAFAKGADLLIHEVMLAEGLQALQARIGNGDDRLMKHWLRAHTLASDAARTAAEAGVAALALHHLIPSDDPAFSPNDWHRACAPYWQGPLYVGRDGLRIDLPPRG